MDTSVTDIGVMDRPMVVPWMMMPEIECPQSDGKRLVWVYAYNAGGSLARNVRISTNIPDGWMHEDAWSNGKIFTEIEELEPEVPVCIGVLRSENPSNGDALWINFDYSSTDQVVYSQRCEIDIAPN